MKVYLDVCSLNRPFDDQGQARIRLEAEALLRILQRVEDGEWSQVSSEMAIIELEAMPDVERRAKVRLLLSEATGIMRLTASVFRRAAELQRLSFKLEDSLHLAAAESAGSDVMLSCDDSVCRKAKRYQKRLRVRVANPLEWLKENE